jgi:hypothetical protein
VSRHSYRSDTNGRGQRQDAKLKAGGFKPVSLPRLAELLRVKRKPQPSRPTRRREG